MLPFTVYDNETGEILRSGQAQNHMADALLQSPGESLLIGEFDGAAYYVEKGRARARPSLPAISVTETGLTFAEMPPDGTTITVESRFINGTFDVAMPELAFAVSDAFKVEVTPPFPVLGAALEFSCSGAPGGDGAQIIAPDMASMKSYFEAAIAARSDELTLQLLGNPTENTQKRWLLKRAMLDRFEAGTLSGADRAAIAEEVRYSGATVGDHLAVIETKVRFQNWVTFRSDGLRAEAEARLGAADSPEAVWAVVEWAETESAAAVAEAEALAEQF